MFDLENPVTTKMAKIFCGVFSFGIAYTIVDFINYLADKLEFYHPLFYYFYLLLKLLFTFAFYHLFMNSYVNRYILNDNWSNRISLNPILILFLMALGFQFAPVLYLCGIFIHVFAFILARNHHAHSGSIQAKTIAQASIGIVFVEFFARMLFA